MEGGCWKLTLRVFSVVFTSVSDFIEEVAVNKKMLQNVIDAFGILGAPLKFVIFPGGTRVGLPMKWLPFSIHSTIKTDVIWIGVRDIHPWWHFSASADRGYGKQSPGGLCKDGVLPPVPGSLIYCLQGRELDLVRGLSRYDCESPSFFQD
jgi:hypothetical protein